MVSRGVWLAGTFQARARCVRSCESVCRVLATRSACRIEASVHIGVVHAHFRANAVPSKAQRGEESPCLTLSSHVMSASTVFALDMSATRGWPRVEASASRRVAAALAALASVLSSITSAFGGAMCLWHLAAALGRETCRESAGAAGRKCFQEG
jgi:hypothetical protein